jgi:hypothetical protein
LRTGQPHERAGAQRHQQRLDEGVQAARPA